MSAVRINKRNARARRWNRIAIKSRSVGRTLKGSHRVVRHRTTVIYRAVIIRRALMSRVRPHAHGRMVNNEL